MKTDPLSGLRAVSARRSEQAGFTLVEMLISIAVLGVLAAIAVPSFREFVAGQRIKTASFDIMAVLTLARSEAIKRNADVNVTPAAGGWENGWTVATSGVAALNQQSALRGVTMNVTCPGGACRPSVSYGGNGRLVLDAGEAVPFFEIRSDASDQRRCISISSSGRPNAKTGGCS